MTPAKLSEILEQHRLWIAGQGGSRANLLCANLRSANLASASLSGANLASADLSGADLPGGQMFDGGHLPRPNTAERK